MQLQVHESISHPSGSALSLSAKVQKKLAAWEANPAILRVAIYTVQGEKVLDTHPPEGNHPSSDIVPPVVRLTFSAEEIADSPVVTYVGKKKYFSLALDDNHILLLVTVPGTFQKSAQRELRWLKRNVILVLGDFPSIPQAVMISPSLRNR